MLALLPSTLFTIILLLLLLLLLLPGYKVKGHDAAVEAEKVVKISKLPQVRMTKTTIYKYMQTVLHCINNKMQWRLRRWSRSPSCRR
jgi:hypothetical protein